MLACGSQPGDLGKIRHTILIIKENRTFDHYFGLFLGADGATRGKVSNGGTVPLNHLSDPSQLNNLCNSWECALEAMDSGMMDKFDLINTGNLECLHAGERTGHSKTNYWAYARNFVLADRYFTSVHRS